MSRTQGVRHANPFGELSAHVLRDLHQPIRRREAHPIELSVEERLEARVPNSA